ncbi:TPR and ankyrin repeat-containing protein 1-like [Chiloscyllium plagiosum]|uniref:TPR and ankyrin repeat-containing protein 1-like n=1 Tax=Chiloscyllium plagiosum TaxID=36176 RepID=UPI001CB81DA9|nr:TPR and ankyrin repeat-containing protein 1-like [Chiloscyllium plagiosum]XP_043544768.1 TPR and ankyrin repeat-containing protein 1-like [Chiloscyllium plagiosum]XP_043544769.1 TPR and ankyrin repeat-containing protein 1-like [Chiloscyllium plagiosum]
MAFDFKSMEQYNMIAHQLKTIGNEAFKQRRYRIAVQKYDEALNILRGLQPTRRELAVLYCNRSNALYNLEMWKLAFDSAQYAIAVDSTFIKGYYWTGNALLKMQDYFGAHQYFYEGLNILDTDRDQSHHQIADFIVGILTCGTDSNFLEILKWKGYNATIWQIVIEKAAKKNLWKALYIVLCDLKLMPGNEYSAAQISLKELFVNFLPMCRPFQYRDWITQLLRTLVSHGVKLESIGPFPLHSILKLAIRTNDRKLLKWIFSQKPYLQDTVNQQDDNGHSLLHVVASWQNGLDGYTHRFQTEDVRYLLQLGADLNIHDNRNKVPIYYLKKLKNFKAVDFINKHYSAMETDAASQESANQMEEGKSACAAVTFEEAVEQFVQFCNSEREESCKNLMAQTQVQVFLQQLSTMTEINTAILQNVECKVASSLIKELLRRHKWHDTLLLLTGCCNEKQSKQPVLKCDLSDLDLCTVTCNLDQQENREWLLQNLMDYGASPCGVSTKESPICLSLKKEDFVLVHLFLINGAKPQDLSLTPGDTPLHAAVCIVLDKKDEIGLHILKYLLEKYSSDATHYPYLNPSCQDSNGNTLLHIIFHKPYSKNHEEIMDLLSKFEINSKIKNKEGKQCLYKIKKDDPRFILWNKAISKNRKKREQNDQSQKSRTSRNVKNAMGRKRPSQQKVEKSESSQSDGQTPMNGPFEATFKVELGHPLKSRDEPSIALTVEEVLVNEIRKMIQEFNVVEIPIEASSSKLPTSDTFLNDSAQTLESTTSAFKTHPSQNTDNTEVVMLNETTEHSNCSVQQDPGPEEVTDLQDLDFDNMTWEIECTSELLKKLSCRDVPQQMKTKIVKVIQQLGNGEWTQSLQKPLKHLNSPIKLYEAKLDKGARMLWELAVDFSPRCSEKPEKIFESELSSHPQERVTGRVYSEIIRIWDIILDHNKLNRALDMIRSSYDRGQNCILRKKLKGINKAVLTSNLNVQKRIPLFFVECIDWKEPKEKVPEYFPPASAVETEYNIMKFHSFSTNMALNILTNLEKRVEYPFRVGELEYAIIDLVPKPLQAIILIGRSGTGKTTCCLYRLWKHFQLYWEKTQIGNPWLVRQVWHKWKTGVMDDDDKESAMIDDGTGSCDYVNGKEDFESVVQSCDSDLHGMPFDGCGSELTNDHEGMQVSPDDADKLEHFHQIFVTKNHVLCQEVLKNFIELSKSTKATSHFRPVEATIYRLQDIKDENFPLFVTSKQLLLLIDASLPDPFFPRNEDGSLKRTIVGWSVQEDMSIPDLGDEDEEEENEGDFLDDESRVAESHTKESDPRIFVTYEVFARDLWPKMVKGKSHFNPALVWKEIKSFLKGSIEALNSPQGCLTEEQYIKLGKKRAPNFQEDRSEIYHFFCLYQQIKSQFRYFDEEDVLYSISLRLSKSAVLPWSIHELYGDEIQDFTQAELATLMKSISDPNSMFLTGDTAQSIMKGVAFRFSDLRSLFYYAHDSNQNEKKQCNVAVPSRIYQLHQNYRSHSGILNLASGVVDLLQYYFPESFDRLPRDSGLFDGPKPSLLESCSVSDLAILLRGNKRKSQPIEFGAHQVILVTNEKAKEAIPEELNLALVLTIYESKGLEFDDVLLYNFFTDSEADKEWRVISTFQPSPQSKEKYGPILEQSMDDIAAQSRPLEFNMELHKLLNCELKQLYTAFTRARVNLWIFDENKGKRDPAFKYFINRDFVRVVKTDENRELDDSMFVKASTMQEWSERGDYFAKHQCWKVAAKCYQKGGDLEKEKLALAHDAVLNVQVKKRSQREIQIEYLQLAKTYLECKVPKLSMKCLRNAKEYKLCAELLEKLGKVGDAACSYRKAQCYRQAANCYEQVHKFELALLMLCRGGFYNEAALAVERYKDIQPSIKFKYSADQFRLEAAAMFLNENKLIDMMASLNYLDPEDQLVFLKSNKCLSQAAELLKSQNREEEAAILMREHGKLQEAARLSNKKEFQAECLLAAARVILLKESKGEEISALEKESIQDMLDEATKLFEIRKRQLSDVAEAMLLKSLLNKETNVITEAFDIFVREYNSAGAVESLFILLQRDPEALSDFERSLTCLEMLMRLVKALNNPQNNAEKEMVKACYAFFGISPVDAKYGRIPRYEGVRILQLDFDLDPSEKQGSFYKCEMKKVRILLQKHFLLHLCDFADKIKSAGQNTPDICPKFICGLACKSPSCQDYHRPLKRYEAKYSLHAKLYLTVLNGILLEAKDFYSKETFPEAEKIEDILTGDPYALCTPLLNAFYPKHFHLRVISESPVVCREVLGLIKGIKFHSFKSVLREYISHYFQCSTVEERRESTDLWIRAQQVYLLTCDYPKKIEDLLSNVEQAYDSERRKYERGSCNQDKRRTGLGGKRGMFPTNTLHLCIFRLLVTSMKGFYEHADPEECIHHFFRFMNVLIRRCTRAHLLIPSIANTVSMLEFQFVLCCSTLMHFKKNLVVCLPRSFIALIHYWNFMFKFNVKNRNTRDAFSIINEFKPKDLPRVIYKIKKHLAYLIHVLCGEESGHFNVLLDAFRDPDYTSSGEAERTAVLGVVMLINARYVLECSIEKMIKSSFCEVERQLKNLCQHHGSKVPARLVNLVENVNRAQTVNDVVISLQELLKTRDDEYLHDCFWNWDHHSGPGSVRGIYFQNIQAERFSDEYWTRNEEIALISEEYYDVPDNVQYFEEKDEHLQDMAFELQKIANLRRKWQCVVHVISACRYLVKFLTQTDYDTVQPTTEVPSNFKEAYVDETQCDICGVRFSRGSKSYADLCRKQEHEEAANHISENWEDNEDEEESETLCRYDCFETHISLEEHIKKVAAYNAYLTYFRGSVEPVMSKGRSMLHSLEEMATDYLTSKELAKVMSGKLQNSIHVVANLIDGIYNQKAWINGKEILSEKIYMLQEIVNDADMRQKQVLCHTDDGVEANQSAADFEEGLEDRQENFDELRSRKRRKGIKKKRKH